LLGFMRSPLSRYGVATSFIPLRFVVLEHVVPE
jgi:hypothetical protein